MVQFVQANNKIHHVRVHRHGTGRPVVFANSLGTDLRIWDAVIGQLNVDGPILCYDKSGHGLSEGGASDIAALADDLAALMDLFDLGPALICGVSVGGMIAQAVAAKRPDLVAGLVLSNTSYKIGDPESWNARIDLLDQVGLEGIADNVMTRWFSEAYLRDAAIDARGFRAMLTRTPLQGYQNICRAIRDADLRDATSQIACPTVCVSGQADLATPPAIVHALAQSIVGACEHVLPGVGHLPCIEVPEAMAALIQSAWEQPK